MRLKFPPTPKNCACCGTVFMATNPNSQFCSRECMRPKHTKTAPKKEPDPHFTTRSELDRLMRAWNA